MAFVHTLNSLKNILTPSETAIMLLISNNSVTIDPNAGSYFYLDNVDDNISITISTLNSSSKTIYLKLNFDQDNIVINWPNNIKWYEVSSPEISKFVDIFVSLMTLDGGTTWYSEPVIKTKPIVDLRYYMSYKYPATFYTLQAIPYSDLEYFSKIKTKTLDYTFSNFLYGTTTYFSNTSYINIDLSMLDTSELVSMNHTFYGCSSLASLDLSNFDTSKVVDMYSTFYGCGALTSLDVSNFDTSSVHSSRCWGTFSAANLRYLILNSTTVKCTITSGLNTTCKILVPSSALNTYKTHSAWSSRASQFDAIENYTITRSNGTITVTPNT